MDDHWTPPLSDEGTQELLEERNERPAETGQRLRLLERFREAVRTIQRSTTRRSLEHRVRPRHPAP